MAEFASGCRVFLGERFPAQLANCDTKNGSEFIESLDVYSHRSSFEIRIRLLSDSQSIGYMCLSESGGFTQSVKPSTKVIAFTSRWAALGHVASIWANTGIIGKGLHEYRNNP